MHHTMLVRDTMLVLVRDMMLRARAQIGIENDDELVGQHKTAAQ
jgi:hypothetical protein